MDKLGKSKRESWPRRRIRDAVERKGWILEDMYWEPIGAMVEKSGRSGGWSVFAHSRFSSDDSVHALGYNVDQVIDFIERYWENR